MIHIITKVTLSKDGLLLNIPLSSRLGVEHFVKGLNDGIATITMKKYYKGRSTGPKSQSHHLWGHAAQLGEHLGYDRREMLYLIAEMTPSWPIIAHNGHCAPASESKIDKLTASQAIDICHRIAAEEGIELIEEEQ